MIIPAFSCQLSEVTPLSYAQFDQLRSQAAKQSNAPGLGCMCCPGLGDYLQNFNWPIPQYLRPGNKRMLTTGMGDFVNWQMAMPRWPQQLAPGARGLGDDPNTLSIGGLSINVMSPTGYFTGSITDWGIAEWGTIAGGLYLVGSFWGDVKSVSRKTRKAARAYRSAS